jgi:thiamine-phosphate pyrophosphorylase
VRAALSVCSARGAGSLVQLRGKRLTGRALFDAALALRALVEPPHRLLVNDRVDVALAVEADGVHLPATGLPVETARTLLPGSLVGRSVHSLDEALAAARAGADYLVFGPVFVPRSDAGPHKAPVQGLHRLSELTCATPCPVFAVGGVDAVRVGAVHAAGARPGAIQALLGADDPARATKALLDALDAALRPG